MNIRALDNQTVGQALTLQCELAITNDLATRSVNIVWSMSDGTELRSTDDVSSTTMGNSLVYTDSYNISQLSTTDDGRVIQCEANITEVTSMFYSDNITLDVIGKYVLIIWGKACKFCEKLKTEFHVFIFVRQLQTFDYWYTTSN